MIYSHVYHAKMAAPQEEHPLCLAITTALERSLHDRGGSYIHYPRPYRMCARYNHRETSVFTMGPLSGFQQPYGDVSHSRPSLSSLRNSASSSERSSSPAMVKAMSPKVARFIAFLGAETSGLAATWSYFSGVPTVRILLHGAYSRPTLPGYRGKHPSAKLLKRGQRR